MKALSRNLLAGALLAALPMGGALACTTSAWTNGGVTSAIAGNPTENDIPRYSGECALQPSGATPFVIDNSPTSETAYRARFYVYTGGVTGSPVIFQATDGDDGSGGTLVQVSYDAGADTLNFTSGGASGSAPAVGNAWYSVELYYAAGSSLSAEVGGNGNAASSVAISGTPAAGSVNSAVLGAVSGGSATNTMAFDEFESTRSTTTGIGRLPPGDANASNTCSAADYPALAGDIVAALLGASGTDQLASGQPDCDENGASTASDYACLADKIVDDLLSGGSTVCGE